MGRERQLPFLDNTLICAENPEEYTCKFGEPITDRKVAKQTFTSFKQQFENAILKRHYLYYVETIKYLGTI